MLLVGEPMPNGWYWGVQGDGWGHLWDKDRDRSGEHVPTGIARRSYLVPTHFVPTPLV